MIQNPFLAIFLFFSLYIFSEYKLYQNFSKLDELKAKKADMALFAFLGSMMFTVMYVFMVEWVIPRWIDFFEVYGIYQYILLLLLVIFGGIITSLPVVIMLQSLGEILKR